MRKLTLILFALLCTGSLFSQVVKKYAIGQSGCSAYFYCDPGTFDYALSPDSCDVYTGECNANGISYGVISVKFTKEAESLESAEDVLVQYLDYLKTTMNIVSHMGYARGYKLKDHDATRGVMDYWKDKDGFNWKIKGWTDGQFICVLYAYTKTEVPEDKVNVFLNSLLFKGM